MKKILSLTLAVLMVIAMIPTALAFVPVNDEYGYPEPHEDCWMSAPCVICGQCPYCTGVVCGCEYPTSHSQGTKVEYTATGSEAYSVTVPAKMTPESSSTVTLQGTWASDRKVTVTADTSVELTSNINPTDKKSLSVTFAGIEKIGDNTEAVSATETVSVGAIENALFGTWSGTFNYNVEITDAVELITFTYSANTGETFTYQAKKGMTWAEFVNSKYNEYKYLDLAYAPAKLFFIENGALYCESGMEVAIDINWDDYSYTRVQPTDEIRPNGMYNGM